LYIHESLAKVFSLFFISAQWACLIANEGIQPAVNSFFILDSTSSALGLSEIFEVINVPVLAMLVWLAKTHDILAKDHATTQYLI
jgi:hypothetical protein